MSAGASARSPIYLLTRLFLRRFVENDLIAPEHDQHVSVSLGIAALLSAGVFVTTALCNKYLIGIQLPGPTLVLALADRGFYILASMLGAAIVMLLWWDALALDPRDHAILGALPLTARQIMCAKLAAIAIFGGVFAVAINGVPSLLYPLLLLVKLPVGFGGLVMVIAAHALVTLTAFAFALLVVLGVRALLQVMMPARWFPTFSIGAQATLLALALGAALLLPALAGALSPPSLRPETRLARMLPPAWFLAANETLAGNVIASARLARVPPRLVMAETSGRRAYESYRAGFHSLSRLPANAMAVVGVLAVALFLWANRRLGEVAPSSGRAAASRSTYVWIARAISRRSSTQAAFLFTLNVLARSGAHRRYLVGAAGVALPVCMVLAVQSHLFARSSIAPNGEGLLAMQAVLTGAVLIGVRRAMTLPVHMPARWAIELTWGGQRHAFLAGVKNAAVALASASVMATFPLYLAILEPTAALRHVPIAVATAALLAELLFFRPDVVPFMSNSRATVTAPRLMGGAAIAAAAIWAIAAGESYAISSSQPLAIALGLMTFASLAIGAIARRKQPIIDTLDPLPDLPTQRLGLVEES